MIRVYFYTFDRFIVITRIHLYRYFLMEPVFFNLYFIGYTFLVIYI